MNFNWKWPSKPENFLVPWYVIIRRLVFWPFLLFGRCLCFVAILGGFGLEDAIDEWKKN